MSALSQVTAIRNLINDDSKIVQSLLSLFTQDENSGKVIDILTRALDSNISQIVNELKEEEKSKVLKCIYIGLAVPENNGKLLRWFGEISQSSGIGTVVRAVNSM